MNYSSILIIKRKNFTRFTTVCLIVLTLGIVSFAQQYKGIPVKKDRLIKALRSKQLQTRDIVTIIRSNGVDFALTADTRKNLIAAGARPEVIRAADENLRLPSKDDNFDSKNGNSSADYADLLDQAIYVFEDKNNSKDAVKFLESAIKLRPKDPAAYQMLGFVNLYGLKNMRMAKKYMIESVSKGGSAVFRVYHDDNGDFTKRCTGSLYISPENIRYESDDNIHTFETSTLSVSKIKNDRESSALWKKHPVFKVFLKIGEAETKFRFAPVSGSEAEAKMVAQLVIEAKIY